MASNSRRTPAVTDELTSTPETQPQVNAEATKRTPTVIIMSDETKVYWIGPCPVREFRGSCILVADSQSDRDEAVPFEATVEKRLKTRSQLVTYLAGMAARQHRTHIFMVFVIHSYARLIRWDRAGIVVSDKFKYVEDCSELSDFFRYSQLSKGVEGYDGTAKLASKEEANHAHTYLAEWAPVKMEREVYKIQVPSKSPDGNTTMRSLLVGAPLDEAASPLGRSGTKGWPVLVVKEGKPIGTVPVFLQEQWRGKDATEGMETLGLLNDKNEHVPTLVFGRDSADELQKTAPHECTDKSWGTICDDSKLVKKIETRIHLRLVTKETGRPLETFASSREMMKVIYDAFKGHQQAYNLCNDLHPDVSVGNTLFLSNGDGFLNDWDLAIRHDESGSPCNGGRAGIWPFMSGDLSSRPHKLHTVRDDLESFFWVVLFYGLHYVPHILSGQKKLDDVIYHIFHHYFIDDGVVCGAGGKEGLLNNTVLEFTPRNPYTPEPFEFVHSLPLTNYIYDARALLFQWQAETTRARTSRSLPSVYRTALWYADPLSKTHDDVKHLFEEALSEKSVWPMHDQAILQLATPKPVLNTTQ